MGEQTRGPTREHNIAGSAVCARGLEKIDCKERKKRKKNFEAENRDVPEESLVPAFISQPKKKVGIGHSRAGKRQTRRRTGPWRCAKIGWRALQEMQLTASAYRRRDNAERARVKRFCLSALRLECEGTSHGGTKVESDRGQFFQIGSFRNPPLERRISHFRREALAPALAGTDNGPLWPVTSIHSLASSVFTSRC